MVRLVPALCLWVLLNSLFSNCFAQLSESDTIRWQTKFNATGSVLDGNVARTLLLNRLQVTHANPTFGMSTRNDFQYGRTRHMLTERDIISYNFFYLRPFDRVYPYVMGLLETNLRRKIDFRYQVGPGASWNILYKKPSVLKLSVTMTYENTQYNGVTFDDEQYNGTDGIEAWRITGRVFVRHKLNNNVGISSEFWWQQSLTEWDNYRYHLEGALEFPLSKHFALRTAVRYSYEKIALIGLEPFDLLWTYGFTFTYP